jgi:hypothetical protein
LGPTRMEAGKPLLSLKFCLRTDASPALREMDERRARFLLVG